MVIFFLSRYARGNSTWNSTSSGTPTCRQSEFHLSASGFPRDATWNSTYPQVASTCCLVEFHVKPSGAPHFAKWKFHFSLSLIAALTTGGNPFEIPLETPLSRGDQFRYFYHFWFFIWYRGGIPLGTPPQGGIQRRDYDTFIFLKWYIGKFCVYIWCFYTVSYQYVSTYFSSRHWIPDRTLGIIHEN